MLHEPLLVTANAPDKQAQADNAVQDQHDGSDDGVTRHDGGAIAVGKHQRDDQQPR
jgi:hypothetical protein